MAQGTRLHLDSTAGAHIQLFVLACLTQPDLLLQHCVIALERSGYTQYPSAIEEKRLWFVYISLNQSQSSGMVKSSACNNGEQQCPYEI